MLGQHTTRGAPMNRLLLAALSLLAAPAFAAIAPGADRT
jgi:hypothetical protein